MIDQPRPVEDAVVDLLRGGVFGKAAELIEAHGLDVADIHARAFPNVDRKDVQISHESWRALVEAAERDLENLRSDLKDPYITDEGLRETISKLERALEETRYE